MRLWIDTEFDGFRGKLISLALVDETGREFYEVVSHADGGLYVSDPWVIEHVIPFLNRPPVRYGTAQAHLEQWLGVYDMVHIVADWPEDIAHFCQFLITGPGQRLATPPLTMEVRRDLEGESKCPHNALADARANREAHLKMEHK